MSPAWDAPAKRWMKSEARARATTVIRIEERRVTAKIHFSVATSDALAALTFRRSLVYGV